MPEEAKCFNLGAATAAGNDAFTQCNFFKQMLRSRIGREPQGTWMETYTENGSRGINIRYYEEVSGSVDYAIKARRAASEIWHDVQHGVKCRTGRE